jgi:O-antigen/teichoic acid export membrane protein
MAGEKNLPSFYSGFIKLFSGLAIVQIVNLLFSLILPRYYSPADYAFFGIFTSIVFILLEIITLKLEMTVYFPKEDEQALEIVHSIFFICFCFAVIILVIILIISYFIDPMYLLLPLSLIIYGIVVPLNAWFNRKKDYRKLNTSRIVQAIAIPLLSLLFIIEFHWHFGLVLGFILGQVAGLLYLFFSFKNFNFKLIRLSVTKKYLVKYKHFPKYGVISSLIGSISKNSIVIFVKYFFGDANAGYYTLSTRILNASASVYQSSQAQVFLQQASHLDNASLRIYIKKIVWFGFLLGVIPVILLLIFGQQIFGFMFGPQWMMAGKMTQCLVLWFFSIAIITPVGLLLDIKQKLRFEVGWNALLLILRISAILIFALLNDLYLMLVTLSAIGILMNVLLLYYILKLTNDKAD